MIIGRSGPEREREREGERERVVCLFVPKVIEQIELASVVQLGYEIPDLLLQEGHKTRGIQGGIRGGMR